jgi:acyl phosphate:glycerol-3-phosphate acyltransferase
MTVEQIIALVIGYLLGSIPCGLIITRLAGKGDIRKIGSGNIGATNVLRTGSKPLAALTLFLDAFKGLAAVLVAQHWLVDAHQFAAAGAMIGHLYPVWLKFRGGKGVATYLGVLFGLLFPAGAVYAAVWLGMLLLVKYSSAAGMMAAVSAPVMAALLGRFDLFQLLLGFTLLVIWKHRLNIARLRAGTEPRVGQPHPMTRLK